MRAKKSLIEEERLTARLNEHLKIVFLFTKKSPERPLYGIIVLKTQLSEKQYLTYPATATFYFIKKFCRSKSCISSVKLFTGLASRTPVVKEIFALAKREGLGELDLSAVFKVLSE